jgi:amino acid adenylation domain-containing protein
MKPRYQSPTDLVDLLRIRADERGDQTAFRFLEDGATESARLTYAELDRRARSLAGLLQGWGLARERALLLFPPGLDFVTAFWGCLYAGVVAVPAYPPRTRDRWGRLDALAADARPGLVLCSPQVAERGPGQEEQVPALAGARWVAHDAAGEAECGAEDSWVRPSPDPDGLAFLQYTSGSTGVPRGVMVTHGNLLHNQETIRCAFRQDERSIVAGWLPMYHDMGLIGNMLQPLYVGGSCILMPPLAFLQQPRRWLEVISRYRATTSGGPDFAYDLCVRRIPPEQWDGLDLSCWTLAFNGAEPVRAATLERFAEAFAACGFDRSAFYPCYGLAEATLFVTGGVKGRLPAVEIEGGRVSCGRAWGDQRLAVVDPETGAELPAGQVGEIWVSGPSVAAGYWNRPTETRETFRAVLPDGCGPCLRTGDLGFMQNGELVVTGRLKDLIILRGRNLYPQDLELTAEQAHPALRAGCAAAFSVDEDGEERLIVVGEIERHPGDLGLIADTVRRAVAEEHGVRVADVALLRRGTIPKTSSGKIRRRECRARYLAGELTALHRSTDRAGSTGRLLTRQDLLDLDPVERAATLLAWLRGEVARRAGVAAAGVDGEEVLAAAGLDSLALFDLQGRLEADLGFAPAAGALSGLSVAALCDQLLEHLADAPETGGTDLPPLVPGEILGDHPLAPGQEALWFLERSMSAAGVEGVFHLAAAARLGAEVDSAALLRAACALVERHPALRTTFAESEGEPRQRVHASLAPDLGELDATAWNPRELEHGLQCEARRPFDLAQGPPLRIRIFVRPGGERVLLLVVHHLVGDFWSLAVLLRDWAALYARGRNGVRDGDRPPLPNLPVAYTDFVRWQRRLLAGPVGERQALDWLERLRGAPLVLDLPIDRPHPRVASRAGALVDLRLGADLTGRVRGLARGPRGSQGTTLFTALLAVYQVLLGRLTGQDDLLVGCPTTGRRDPDLAGVVGYFVNPVVLRADLAADLSFAAHLAKSRQAVAAALESRDLPFAELARRLQPARDSGRPPVFQAVFVLQRAAPDQGQTLAGFSIGQAGMRIELEGLALESLRLDRGTAQFELSLSAAEVGDGLVLSCEHSTALFDRVTIERWLGHLQILLEVASLRPEERIGELPWMSEAERQQTVLEWNVMPVALGPAGLCLPELLVTQASRTPDAVAVVFAGDCLSYGELDRRSNRLARHLRALGVEPEVRVGLCLEPSLDLVIGLIAVLKSGGAYVPLDSNQPRERLDWMLQDSSVAVVATRMRLAGEFAGYAGALVRLDEDWGEIDRQSEEPLCRGPEPDNLAYVIYTSGSTGVPKGVPITHENLVPLLLWSREVFGFGAHTRALQSLSSAFDFGVFEVLTTVLWGGTLFLRRGDERSDVELYRQEIRRYAINTVHVIPSFFHAVAATAVAARERLSTIEVIHLGGEALSKGLVEEAFSVAGEGCRLFNGYGPTEAAINCALFELGRAADQGLHGPGPVPIGRPSAASRLHVLDRWAQPVPVGVPGELLVGGVGLSRGYLGRPGQTAARFIPDPFGDPGGRLYRTGDLVRFRTEGVLEFLGRIDHQVKIRGFRIELGEIEAALTTLPGVREAVVVAREAVRSPGDRQLVGYLTGDVIAEALLPALRKRLPDHMIPAAFVTLAELPLTSSGKVDRKALPPPEWQSAEESHMAPRTPVEEVLAGIWAELLGLERVGAADDFFALGGHSLLATRVMSRLRTAFRVEMPLRDLFEAPKLADFANRVEVALRAGAAPAAPPLIPGPREGPPPLSFAQQRLWFIDQLEPGSPLYNMPATLRADGPLDAGVLARTLGEIVRRHEALRTIFPVLEGAPAQVIQPAVPFVLPLVDLTGLPESRRESWALGLAGEEARRPFDLTRDPLLRGAVLRLSDADHVLTLTMHHIASDGWSMGVLVREVTALYAAYAESRPSPLPELAVQYADFAAWQRSWLHGATLEGAICFWRRQLAGLPPHLSLPTDRPRPAVQSFRGTSRPIGLPHELIQAAQALGRREGATLFMVLLAGFQALLARYSGQEDFAVGSPVAGRNRVEIEGLVGFFVNTLVLRGDLAGEPSFRELLGRVRETALEAYLHQEVPFEKLVEELAPEKSLAHTPLFQVMLVLQNAPVEILEIRNLSLRPVRGTGTTAKFDLTISLEEQGGLAGTVTYATDLFDTATIDRLTGHFERLLAEAMPVPETSVFALPFLNTAELHQLVQEEGNSPAPLPAPELCVHELFAAQVARAPTALALVDEEGVWTYAELGLRVRWLARCLRAVGVEPDQPVLLCAGRGARLVVGLLGILEAGGAYLAVEPDLPRARMELLAEDACVSVAVTERPLASTLPSRLQQVLLDADDATSTAESAGGMPPAAVTPGHLAYVLYTSGSTGAPKGVMVEHRQLTAYVRGALERLAPPPGASFATVSSFAADLGNTSIFAALLGGCCLHVPGRERLADAAAFAELMERRPVDILKIVPSHLAALLTAERPERLLPRRLLVLGGEPLPWSLVERVRTLVPECRIFNHYGPTETAVGVLAGAVGEADAVRSTASVPLGRPLGLALGWVVDRHLQLVPAGVPGELCVGGPQVTRGYLGRPDLTAERFIPDPFGAAAGERIYRTGDLVRRRPGGPVEFLGRTDHQVKVRGFRIELGEIEAALRALPGVREAVVVAREDRSERGAGDRRLVAYVVGDDAAGSGTEGALRLALRERLPDYMVPAAFVTLAELPLTPNGKLDRKALPAPQRQSGEEIHLAPHTPVEELLAGIWAELLGLERVGATDHFFEKGGHSLLATQVMSRLGRAFGVEMPLRDLFEAPTPAGLAVRVEAALRAGSGRLAPPLISVPREGPSPLSFAQQRLWFIDQLEPDSSLYNIPVALRVEGPLDGEVLALCLGEIMRRHEALRTVFATRDSAPVQVIQPVAPFSLPLVDLAGLPARTRDPAALFLANEEADRPFDLGRGPLLRGVLLRLAEEEHVLALTVHHIGSDGWSMGILVREAALLYAAFSEGRPSPLPELPVQYADFAVWQSSWLQGEILESEVSFWRRQLAGLPPLLELPTDRPRPAVQSFRGASRPVRLPTELTRHARALCRHEGATLYMVLLAGFQALLARYSGQQNLAVGSPIAGRNRIEIEGLIGFFVNTLVLRSDLAGEPTFRELLSRVRETALAAYLHQDVPFDRLVEELAPERSLAQTPLFQVVLVLQNARAGGLEIPGLHLRLANVERTTAKFDATLSLEERDGSLAGEFEYSTDLFDAATIGRLAKHFEWLLTAAAATPDLRVSDLPLLAATERHQVFVEWRGRGEQPCSASTLHSRFAARSRLTPEAPALTCGDVTLSYGELNCRSNQLARRLRGHGAGPESRVGLCMDRSPDLVVGILGILKAGAAYVPLDPGYPRERLAYIIEDAGIQIVVATEEPAATLPDTVGQILLDAHRELLERLPAGDLEPLGDGASLAYVIYTSGSTGHPKGALIAHGHVAGLFDATEELFGFGEQDVWTLFHSYAFDFSVWEIWGALLYGGRLVIVPWEMSRSPELFLDLLRREQVTVLNQTPSAFARLAQVDAERGGAATDLRLVIFGGEALDPAGLAPWFARHGDAQPLLVNMYGITETTVHVTWRPLCAAGSRKDERRSVIGMPIPGLSLAVMDAGLRPVPIGVPGELVIGGAGLARGYLGRPGLTAERFVPDPAGGCAGGRLYRSGDLGRFLPQGEVEYLGRIDHQVKIRGIRIELGEIEAALTALEGVREAVVVAREDPPGSGERRLVAYAVGDAAPGALRRGLRERLPEHMVPAIIVTLAALPLTHNGKVDRKALPAPEGQSSSEEGWLAPRTPVEEVLAGIWAELLGLERVGTAGHFFDLGGHSLLATQVMSRLRGAFGVAMPLRDLFEAPVLADLASRIEASRRSGAVPPTLPLGPQPRHGPLPLSFAQQRLWIIDQLEPVGSLYNVPVALRLEGPLDAAVLARSLCEIVRRHEALRTVFAAPAGTPVQVIRPAVSFALPLVDLAGLVEGARAELALALAGEEARRPFDLTRDPLLRGALLRLADADHVLVLTIHHIASDGWSMGVLVREVTALYAAWSEGRPSPLLELPIQYADYAAWQRKWLDGAALDRLLAYWLRQLGESNGPLALPADRARPAHRSGRGGVRTFRLPVPLAGALSTLARREEATLFMVLLSAFDALLYRVCGQEDVRVGFPIAHRNREEIEGLIGFFSNTLVLRAHFPAGLSFLGLLKQVRETTLGAFDHQDLPFEKLVESMGGEQSRDPLQAIFGLQNAPMPDPGLAGLRLTPLDVDNGRAKFDLVLTLAESSGHLDGSLQFDSDLFDTTTAARLVEYFVTLLSDAAEDPARSIKDLSLLSAGARQRLLIEANDTHGAAGELPMVTELFGDVAARCPDEVAVVWTGDQPGVDRELSYRDLDRSSSRLACWLHWRGIGPGRRVGICLGHSPAMIVAVLGVLKAGAAYVPLDPRHPRGRLTFLACDAGIAFWLTDREWAGQVPAGVAPVLDLQSGWEEVAQQPEAPLPPPLPESPAYVIYTSGSTGRPKGVVLSHRSLSFYTSWAVSVYLTEPALTLPLYSSLAFDLTVTSLFPPLVAGHRIRIYRGSAVRVVEDIFREGRVDVVKLTPSHLALVQGLPCQGSRIRRLIVGGEALDWSLAAELVQAFGGRLEIFNEYGPTEAAVGCMIHRFAPGDPRLATVPIGRPAGGDTIYVLDAGLSPVPENVTGEIYIGGEGLAQSYLGQPALTAERFLPNPFAPGERVYRSGDLARVRADGTLEFLGRRDSQVKLHGHRLELDEIRAALVEHSQVRDAVVRTLDDGQRGQVLAAYYVARHEQDATALRAFLAERLAEEVLPSFFVHLRRLPLTLNGKVNLEALPGLAEIRERISGGGAVGREAPRSPTVDLLTVVWTDVLRVPRIGEKDNFFALGGHSLLGAQVIARVRETFGVDLALRALFERPTLVELAELIDAEMRAGRSEQTLPLATALRDGELPLSFAQHRIWFMEQLQPGRATFNLAGGLRLTGRLDIDALMASLVWLVCRHESLRSSFPTAGGRPTLVIAPELPLILPVVDLSALADPRRRAVAESLTQAERRRPFDLAAGPLLRCVLLRLAPSEHLLLIGCHHLVCDGVSLDRVFHDLTICYRAFTERKAVPLASLRFQYVDFAVWQRRWLTPKVIESQLAYWRRQLADRPARLVLPADRYHSEIPSGRGGTHTFTVPETLLEQLRALGRSHGVTLFMTLLAAYQLLLHRYSGEDRIPVGSPIATRHPPETAEMVGLLLNTTVLCTDVGGNPTFAELLHRVREVTLGAHAHQDLPFELLVEALAPGRSGGSSPLFQVWFVCQRDFFKSIDLPGLEATPVAVSSGFSQFDLILSVLERDHELAATFTYAEDLFRPAVIEEMSHHLIALLEAIAADERCRLLQIPLTRDRDEAAAPAIPPALSHEETEDHFAF